MTGLARIEEARRRLRDRLPLAPGHALFVALVLLTPYARLYASFYYIVLLIPFLLLLDARDGRALAGSWVLRFALAYLGLLWLSAFWTPDTPPKAILRIGRHILANFSFITHFDAFTKGIVDPKDVIFFLSLTGLTLFLNVVALER